MDESDLQHFDAATAKLAAQYDTYKPFPDLSINGKQTLAENIADVAGIAASYDGDNVPRGKLDRRNRASPATSNSFSRSHRLGSKERDAALRQQVMTDSHSPGQFRAATVRNIDAWYAASK